MLWLQGGLLSAALLFGTSTASQQHSSSAYWSAWHGPGGGWGNPWQWPGPRNYSDGPAGGYWLDQSRDILATMQSTYWNGTYWPTTLQWEGALISTIIATTERYFTDALVAYQGNVPGARTDAAQIQFDIRKYYSQIEAYYGGEDTIQIFDAAYDDAQWVVLEWLEAIKFVKQYDAYSKSSYGQQDIAYFAHRAHIFYNIVQDQFNTSLCEGGVDWNPALSVYKNAITNELFVSSSIAMYLYWPGDISSDPYPSPDYTNKTLPPLPSLKIHDPLLLQNAREEWAWFKSHNFTNAQGLIVDGFHISDGQTTCDRRNEMVYTYNQGVMLSGLRGLWEATGDTTYLEDGYNLIDTVISATGWHAPSWTQASEWAGLGRNGIMEDYCDAPASCNQDQSIFKGAYFRNLNLFCEPLPISAALVPGLTYTASPSLADFHDRNCHGYARWVQHNAYAALCTRNSTSDIIGQWWGAPYFNKTQAPSPAYGLPIPEGSVDICNDPGLLDSSPWKCDGRYGCEDYEYSGHLKRGGRSLGKRAADQERTVETQAQGLAVVNAAGAFTLKRKSYGEYVDGR
ncbi:glycoside hydrolase family 76 [Lecanosticta acicola]|uniref:Glycoside hydrolase family 76 n=1 Tax=Lecanosticta acicola TaxID=111012 RepID=A0AAI8Z3E5_9PEZI|nr:glycoside hydrolase family 76 [Lecanosticta acicola]